MRASVPRWWAFLAAAGLLLQAGLATGAEFRLDRVRQSLTATHRHYQQFIDGVPVVGGERLTIRTGSEERVVYERAAREPRRDRATTLSTIAAPPGATFVYVNVDGEARAAFRTIVERRPLERFAITADAATGEVISEVPLFFRARGNVFDVNPVALMNAPELRDSNDSAFAVPPGAYDKVDLGVEPSGPLRGSYARIVDEQAPFTTRADAAQSLEFNRGQVQFEEVNSWFQVDRAQRYLRSLGYIGDRTLVAYSIPIDAHAANGTDNSYYVPGPVAGEGTLFFGDGGTDDAEDSDLVLHEFAHAIHDWISPGALTGPVSSQARAISEGFGDYWAFSSTYQRSLVSLRDPYCIADWDARCAGDAASENCGYPEGADCLRRVDSTRTMLNYVYGEQAGTEHLNGAIWSSALREIFMQLVAENGLEAGKRICDSLVLESLFSLPPGAQFSTMVNRMLDADRQLRGGADLVLILVAMGKRGLVRDGPYGTIPRGERNVRQSPEHHLPIPDAGAPVTSSLTITDTRSIARLGVRVDVDHPTRGDLALTLVAPDGTRFRLKEASAVDRVAGLHVTFGVDASSLDPLDTLAGRSAAGTWQLVVADVFSGDRGVLQSWGLHIEFSGSRPLETRPSSAERIIIPVAGHVTGANGTQYRSDLQLLNRGTRVAHVTVVFTRSGTDGRRNFAAVTADIEPEQTIVFEDVVQQLFTTTAIGALEINGDVADLVVSSNSYLLRAGATIGETVDPLVERNTAGVDDPPLVIAPVPAGLRSNFGLVEIAGGPVTVKLTARTSAGVIVGSRQVDVLALGHLQFAMSLLAQPDEVVSIAVDVVGGTGRVGGYASLVDDATGDATYIAAKAPTAEATRAIIPALTTSGDWRSAMWYASSGASTAKTVVTFHRAFGGVYVAEVPGRSGILPGALELLFRTSFDYGWADVDMPAGTFVLTRLINTDTGTGQTIDPVPASLAFGRGQTADLVRVENTASFRTNIGIAEISGRSVRVRVMLLSAAGRPISAGDVPLGAGQMTYFPLSALRSGEVEAARVRFEVVEGDGRVFGFASVIDNRSGDATFLVGR